MVNRARRRHIEIAQVVIERVCVDRTVELRQRHQRLQLRRERKDTTAMEIVEWLDAEAVADERKTMFLSIPNADGEHADESAYGPRHAPTLKGPKYYLGVRASSKTMTLSSHRLSDLAIVVDLAVEHQRVSAGLRLHRLVPCRRQVDNRESSESQRHPILWLHPDARIVWPAMRKLV